MVELSDLLDERSVGTMGSIGDVKGLRLRGVELTMRLVRTLGTEGISDMDVFDVILESMNDEESQALMDAYNAKVPERMQVEEADEFPRMLSRAFRSPGRQTKMVLKLLEEVTDRMVVRLRAEAQGVPNQMLQRLEQLGDVLGLNATERQVLEMLFLVHMDVLKTPGSRWQMHVARFAYYAAWTGLPEAEVQTALKEDGRLVKMGLVDDDFEFSGMGLPFLQGVRDTPFPDEPYREMTEPALPWTAFGSLAKTEGVLLTRLLTHYHGQGPLNILLYGIPGSGKTAFARALAEHVGRKLYAIMVTKACGERHRCEGEAFRFAALDTCLEHVQKEDAMILVDEADTMLSTSRDLSNYGESDIKARINEVMDNLRVPVIWIINRPISSLSESTRRRFALALPFMEITNAQRVGVWKVQAKLAECHLPSKTVERLATQYPVAASGVAGALTGAKQLGRKGKPFVADVERLLQAHCEMMGIHPIQPKKLSTAYALEGLNITRGPSPEQMIQTAKNFLKSATESCPRLTVLLSGPPGTGKTAFVNHLGEVLGYEVRAYSCSDLLSCLVGMTEQKIAQAFRSASGKRVILFFDEIDSLLRSRGSADHSWEVTQVNEILQQMEAFKGIFVAATNFSESLDAACLRRFNCKVEFGYLQREGIAAFHQRIFGFPATEATLRLTNLTPGDFAAVRQYLLYEEGALQDPLRVQKALVEESERKEQTKGAEHKIGFGA